MAAANRKRNVTLNSSGPQLQERLKATNRLSPPYILILIRPAIHCGDWRITEFENRFQRFSYGRGAIMPGATSSSSRPQLRHQLDASIKARAAIEFKRLDVNVLASEAVFKRPFAMTAEVWTMIKTIPKVAQTFLSAFSRCTLSRTPLDSHDMRRLDSRLRNHHREQGDEFPIPRIRRKPPPRQRRKGPPQTALRPWRPRRAGPDHDSAPAGLIGRRKKDGDATPRKHLCRLNQTAMSGMRPAWDD